MISESRSVVVIVGGGPVGLVMSAFLADLGVESIVLNSRAMTSKHPKARGINARAMELFRQLGMEHFMREAAEDDEHISSFAVGPDLSTALTNKQPFHAADLGAAQYTCSPGILTSQDVVEEVIYRSVLARPLCDVRYGHSLIDFESQGDRYVLSVDSGDDRYSLTCDYLIAADGANSFVRQQLGLEMHGEGPLANNVNFLFRSGQLKEILDPENIAFAVMQREGRMAILSGRSTGQSDREWTLNLQIGTGETISDFPQERMCQMVVEATGVDVSDIEPRSILPWTAASRVLDDFRHGNIFFMGDAAHIMPPAGALGMNTGIQDAQNLAWKLAAVLQRRAHQDLLDTYSVERQPVCDQVVASATRNLASLKGEEGRKNMWAGSQLGIVLGFFYESGCFVPENVEPRRPDNPYSQYLPVAAPGHRAPHIALRGLSPMSLLDFFGKHWVLVCGRKADAWLKSAQAFSGRVLPVQLGRDFETRAEEPHFNDLYGISADGAVLVRPDGIVAARWTDKQLASAETITSTFDKILSPTAS